MIEKKHLHKKTITKKILPIVLAIVCLGIIHGVPASAAECGGAETAIISCTDDEGGVWHILNLIINILSIGVGILGIIGISVAGIQFLTAKDSPEQVKKAKTRIGQIVVGLALYASLFTVAQWLLPGGLINAQSNIQSIGTTTQINEQEQQREEAKNDSENGSNSNPSGGGNNSGNNNNPGGNNTPGSNDQKTKSQRLSDVAWKLAKGKISYAEVAKVTGYFDYMKKNCYKIGGGDCGRGEKGYKTFCSGFVYNVVHYSGVDPNYPMKLTGKQMKYANNSSKWQNVTSKVNGKTSRLKPGDVLIKEGHTLMITANSKGRLYTAQAAVTNFPPKVSKIASKSRLDNSAGNLSKYQVFRIVE